VTVTQADAPEANAIQGPGRRAAEGERDDGDAGGADQGQLLLPAVLVVARLAGVDPVAVGLGGHPRGVGRDRIRIARPRRGHEQVHPERPVGGSPQGGDLLDNGPRRPVARSEEPETPSLADGYRQLRRRGTTRHGRLHDGDGQGVEVHQGEESGRPAAGQYRGRP